MKLPRRQDEQSQRRVVCLFVEEEDLVGKPVVTLVEGQP